MHLSKYHTITFITLALFPTHIWSDLYTMKYFYIPLITLGYKTNIPPSFQHRYSLNGEKLGVQIVTFSLIDQRHFLFWNIVVNLIFKLVQRKRGVDVDVEVKEMRTNCFLNNKHCVQTWMSFSNSTNFQRVSNVVCLENWTQTDKNFFFENLN